MINYIATNPGTKAFLSKNVVKSTFSAITHDYCSFTVVMFFYFTKNFFALPVSTLSAWIMLTSSYKQIIIKKDYCYIIPLLIYFITMK